METFFASRGIPLENLRQTCPLCPFLVYLLESMDAKEAISRMEGIRCGFKPTSCPDQLAKALKEALN